jgi:hypothetical protein
VESFEDDKKGAITRELIPKGIVTQKSLQDTARCVTYEMHCAIPWKEDAKICIAIPSRRGGIRKEILTLTPISRAQGKPIPFADAP